MKKAMIWISAALCGLVLAGCSQTPDTGPTASPIPQQAESSEQEQKESSQANSQKPQSSAAGTVSQTSEISIQEQEEQNMIRLQIGEHSLTAELAENSSAEAFRELLTQGPVTVQMSDYGNMEKVGPLPTSLPENNEQLTTSPGDLILYQGTSITLYYDTNSWSLTRLGRVQNITQQELRDILGEGDVEITFSMD